MKRLIKFLVPPNKEIWDIPGSQYQQKPTKPSPDELILIRRMYARNAYEARTLMDKLNVSNAEDAIQEINRRKPTVGERVKQRTRLLIRRLEGATNDRVQHGEKMKHKRL